MTSRASVSSYPPDLGCAAASACLECPISVCRHDDYAAFLKEWQAKQGVAMLAWRERGGTTKQIAGSYGLSERRVRDLLYQARQKGE